MADPPAPALRVEPLSDGHDRTEFTCGVDALDRYVRVQVGQDVRKRVATCFVLVAEGDPIPRGYYTLAATTIGLTDLPAAQARRLPRYPLVPATLMGRLAVALVHRCQRLGERLLRRPGPRRLFDAWTLRLPLLGQLLRDRITAQLCRALATCLGGGLDLPSALVVSRDILGNLYARAAMDQVVTAVRTGRTVADSLAQAGIMTPLAVKMLRVGEESGRLQIVAAHLAGTFEDRVATRLQRLVAIIEPATVIVLGLVVGGIVMSILTAVLSVNDLAL